MKSKNILLGNSIQAKFAVRIYKRLKSREWFSYADVMADFKGLKSADELPYTVTAYESEYRALKKAFLSVREALSERLGHIFIEENGNIRAKSFRYIGADPDPLADMQFEGYKNDLQDYFDFCQSSAGFMPSSWIEYFLARTLDLFEIKSKKKKGTQIIGTSMDRVYINIELLPQLYDYILGKKVIKFTYKERFNKLTHITFHPHYLKEFNGRWHIFGHAEGKEPHDAYDIALDRIVSCPKVVKGVAYIESQVRYPDFFDDIIGTTHDAETPIYDNIIVRIHSEYMFGLMESKPIHQSQKTVLQYSGDTGYGEISLRLQPNNEFYGRVLQMGADLEIIESPEIRDEMAKRVKDLITRYT